MKSSLSFSLLLILCFITITLDAQRWKFRRYEAFFGIGTAQHFGDIGGAATAENAYGFKDIQLEFTRPVITAGARFKLNRSMATKLNLSAGFLTGNDIDSKNESTRNYSFKSTIFESSLQYEYYLISDDRRLSSGAVYNKNGMINNIADINLYLFTGVGLVYSHSTVFDSTGTAFTRDFYSKFEGDSYPKMGLTFPLGIGLKYVWDNNWSFGLEFGRRFTTADYLDGYSSIYSTHTDVYDFLTFNAIYKIVTDRRGRPIFGRAARARR
jgi:hypothetical protein